MGQQDEASTYTNVRSDKPSNIKGIFEESANAIEDHEYDTCYQTIACFEPLPMRLVRIASVVAIVHICLCLGRVAICLSLLKCLEESQIRCAYCNVNNEARDCTV